jgi:hypothetical protein
MKTVVALIEKPFICPVAVSVPDWWDDATTVQRLGTPDALGMLEDMADPDAWEEGNAEPEIKWVRPTSEPVEPSLAFDDEPPPVSEAQMEFPA